MFETARLRSHVLSSRTAALCAVLLLTLPNGGVPQEPAPVGGVDGELGETDLAHACSEAAGAHLDRGLALLHHMMYGESRRAFEEAAGADPQCAVAHWGMAMTRVHPLWHPAGPEALREGMEHLETAEALGPGTAPARALVEATEPLFRDPDSGDWWERLDHWAEAMGQAHASHPDDLEIAALFGLAQLAAAQGKEDRVDRHGGAARLLARVLEREPRHPGGVHYTIHANDVTGRAGEALGVVRSYDEIAPSVPHALHMPTHIFVRLGDWPAVIEWNRKSADAALRFPPAPGVVSLHYPHAMDYLLYAHLQRGADDEARKVLEETLDRERFEENFASAFHLAAMPARWTVERRAWEEAARIQPRTPASVEWDRYSWPEAMSWFARGLGLARTGRVGPAREALARVDELQAEAERTGQSDHAAYIEIDRRILAGWIAYAEGRPDAALRELGEAARLERSVQKHPVTPGSLLPAQEARGEVLLALERPDAALVAFEASLETWPGRYRSLLGAARAARAAGRDARARDHYSALLEVVEGADSDRPGVLEARERVGVGADEY